MPSGPITERGVSTWTSKRSARSSSPSPTSRRSSASANSATWSGVVTFGNVTTNPSGNPPAASVSVVTNVSSVRRLRASAPSANDFTRRPNDAGAVPSVRAVWTARAASSACRSSSSSGREP